jgi:predicted metal-dependent phosphotriesterase family hydrolase
VLLFDGLKKEGLSQGDIDQMSKVNPARVLSLP